MATFNVQVETPPGMTVEQFSKVATPILAQLANALGNNVRRSADAGPTQFYLEQRPPPPAPPKVVSLVERRKTAGFGFRFNPDFPPSAA